jgi:hypothetical protein
MGYTGLAVVNDGEPAYDISIFNVAIGTSGRRATLEFQSGHTERLTKDDGEAFYQCFIQARLSGTFGSALFDFLREEGIESVTVPLTYRDHDNHWFRTEITLTRDVEKTGRLRLNSEQMHISEPPSAAGSAAPASLMRWPGGERLVVAGIVVAVLVAISAYLVHRVGQLLSLERRPPSALQVHSVGPSEPLTQPSVPRQDTEQPPMNGESAKSIEELRRKHHVDLIRETESGETLSEVPAGSYGFTFAEFVGGFGGEDHPESLSLLRRSDSESVEIHKLVDGHSEFVVYVGPETLERVRHGLLKGEKLTFYTSAWKEAPNLVSIPVNRTHCERARRLESDRDNDLYALDCQVK